jgi:AraC-like DNA-binding protein
VGAAARLTRPAIALLFGHSRDVAGLLADVGLTLATVFNPGARIPHRVLFDLWARAAARYSDPDFGLNAVASVDLRVFDHISLPSEYLPAQMFAASPTLGEGLTRLARYQPLSLHASELALERPATPAEQAPADSAPIPPGAVRVRHSMLDPPDDPRQFTEFWLAWIFRLIRGLTATPVTLLEVRFAHPEPASTVQHLRAFAAPVRFSAGEDALILREADLAAALRTASPALADLERHAAAQLGRMPPVETLPDRVRALVAAELTAGSASATQVARAMRLSSRTLTRRLAELGTSYQALLDEVRAGLAHQYLLEDGRSVEDVAGVLGFSDARAFLRAFQRWFGQSLSTYRRGYPG